MKKEETEETEETEEKKEEKEETEEKKEETEETEEKEKTEEKEETEETEKTEEKEETEENEEIEEHKKFLILHILICIFIFLVLIFSPLKYYKYIAWILLAISFHWIIFNGCVLDKLHNKTCNNSNIPTNNITPVLKLLNNNFANYIDEIYLKNTMRPAYIIFFTFILILTIMIYRLIYNIDFF